VLPSEAVFINSQGELSCSCKWRMCRLYHLYIIIGILQEYEYKIQIQMQAYNVAP